MMVSELVIDSYLASPEDVESHQEKQLEETISEVGNAFGALFQAGKELFVQAIQDAGTAHNEDSELEISESLDSESNDAEEFEEELPDNVIDLDQESSDEVSDEGFMREVKTILNQSAGEFQSIFSEAKEGLKKTLKEKETLDFLRNLGNQIVEFADTLELSSDEESSESSEEERKEESSKKNSSTEEDKSVDEEVSTEPPPAVQEESTSQNKNNREEDSDEEIPPSPLPDSD
jgi:hypothetical protein